SRLARDPCRDRARPGRRRPPARRPHRPRLNGWRRGAKAAKLAGMFQSIGIVGSGDMGHAVGRALKAGGRRVLTPLAERSARSRRLAEAAGVEDAGGLPELVGAVELVLSIVPPAAARDVATAGAAAVHARGRKPHFADCNAVSPTSMDAIAGIVGATGAVVTDCGIVGMGPRPGGPATRFYVSGPQAAALTALDGNGIAVKPLGPEIGRASAM